MVCWFCFDASMMHDVPTFFFMFSNFQKVHCRDFGQGSFLSTVYRTKKKKKRKDVVRTFITLF